MQSSTNNNLREDRDWLKVSELSVGMQIAVPKAECFADHGFDRAGDSGTDSMSGNNRDGDVLWDEIAEIRELPEEQVWDIEVLGTHNFVAGHLHPHADVDTDVEVVPRSLTEEEEKAWLYKHGMRDVEGDNGTDSTERQCRYRGVFAHNTYLDGDLGIGTPTPGAKLSILDETTELRDAFSVATSTTGSIFRVDTAGDAFAAGAFNSGGADYAEHFYADSADLAPGEVVCVSLENENAVARCVRPADGNIMGIVSTNPAIVGNAGNIASQKASVVVGMLGQVPAKVSNENGPIRPGDSLTSASLPGYAAKAGPGDSTVGVALERLDSDTGTVRILISRRNKSLTVAQVEEAVVDRIAAMEIEDEVALLVSDAVSGYDFDPVVSNIIGGELALLEQDFDLRLSGEIAVLAELIKANKLEMIGESADLVAINTNLTVKGELEAESGLIVPLFPLDPSASLGVTNGGASSTLAFKVSTDGIVTAYSDFIISDGVNATSVKDVLAALTAPAMTKTELTVTQDLYVGNSFEVMGGQVAGATTMRPVFRIALDGTVSVREDIVLSGYTAWNDIPGIVSLFAYNTANDIDAGAWVAGNRSASWYVEPIDATAEACDILANDRCGSRSFPTHAVIAATSDTIYIFNAQDGSLWKKLAVTPSPSGILGVNSAEGSNVNTGTDPSTPLRFGRDDGDITALYAADGALYLAQGNTVSVIDFKNDVASSVPAITSNAISGLHSQRINSEPYLAVSGDAGVDLINITKETSSHYTGATSNARLTASGDLWTVASSTISVFTRAYNKEELAPDTSYTASSTLQGLYVTRDGNTAYTASGSDILVLSLNRHPDRAPREYSGQAPSRAEGSMPVFTLDPSAEFTPSIPEGLGVTSGGDVLDFTVDEQAQVIYAAYEGGVKALALGDGRALAAYESGEDSMGRPWTLSGPTSIASLTVSGPIREGDLLSDTLVIATPQGLLAQSGDYSVRQSLASGLSGNGAPNERSNRLFVTDEALFSGRIMVTDNERAPVFAIDEATGNTIVREDIVFSSDARMQSMPGVASVFVYDTTQDNDGGQWSTAFPQKSVLAAAGNTVHIYNARTKELWGTYESSGIASIRGLAAKDGILAIYGDEGLALVDLASGEESAAQSVEAAITGIAFDGDGELYYATAQEVYSIRHPERGYPRAEGSKLIFPSDPSAEFTPSIPEGLGVTMNGIAFIKNTLYISHEQGIAKVNLATGETGDIGAFGAVTSISTASRNTLLIAYQDEVAEIRESGDIINTWTNEQEKKDRNNLPYLASSVSGASASDGAYAIAVQTPSGDSFVWMETQEQSLRDMLNAPRNVFTVIDRVQTPRIASVSSLSFTASSTISFATAGTSTPALVVRDTGDVSISGDLEISGKVGMGTLDVAGDARFSSITSSGASLGTTTVSELKVMEGYFQMNALDGVPDPLDCDSADEYARMAFDAQSETLYLCGPQGFRAFSPDAAAAPDAAGG